MRTTDLMAFLRRHPFGRGPHAFFENVPNSTGAAMRRSCDAIAMGLWPSDGLLVHGFELKVSRGDWLRELRQPEKATELQRFCDRWWLVAGDSTVCPLDKLHDELPSTWGLLVAGSAGELVVVKEAPTLIPAGLDRGFVASLARKMARGSSTIVGEL